MPLGQAVQISAAVCDERALFEREVLNGGYELAAQYRESISLGFARAARVLLRLAVSLRVARRQAQSGQRPLSTVPTESDVRPSALPAATAGARLVAALCLGAAVAFALSLQYLAQPFVWRNWPVEEMLEGWLFIFRDRLIVTVLIAAAISVTARVRTGSLQLRAQNEARVFPPDRGKPNPY
jgi:hypothetical protein